MILGEVVFASGSRILCELLLSTDRTVAVRDENGLIVIATRSKRRLRDRRRRFGALRSGLIVRLGAPHGRRVGASNQSFERRRFRVTRSEETP